MKGFFYANRFYVINHNFYVINRLLKVRKIIQLINL